MRASPGSPLAITGTRWNGPRFFGLREKAATAGRQIGRIAMRPQPAATRLLRCAIYTRVSTDHGLDQNFNSLDAQREASEAYIKSQAHEGWRLTPGRYDDGGFSGGSLGRPALQKLLDEVRARKVDVIVVYKVDRLTRSLADFAKLVELFDEHGVSFVSVTQAFNTTTSMGRLTLNVLLSFAQFEREVTGERIRDKIAASKQKGLWMGGTVPHRLPGGEPQTAGRRERGGDRAADLRAIPPARLAASTCKTTCGRVAFSPVAAHCPQARSAVACRSPPAPCIRCSPTASISAR